MTLGGPSLLTFTAVYIVAVVSVATIAAIRERRRADPSADPRDEHELGGRGLSFAVLLATLFATQYSGNSFVGFTGKAARDGYPFLGGPLFMQSVIVGYLLFAPQLFKLSRAHNLRTPGDFFRVRYEHRGLHLLCVALMLFALLNFVLSQLVAVGKLIVVLGATDAGPALHPAWGIFSLAVLMAAYENIGGMRAVAWTDLLQGVLLFFGVAGLFFLIETSLGGFSAGLESFAQSFPEKIGPPDGRGLAQWFGSIVLFGAGAAVYPHAIQRIYAADSARSLRRSLAWMGAIPLVTTLPLVLMGIFAQSQAGAEVLASDRAMPFLLELASRTPLGTIVTLMVLGGAVAAMMSTADSALLTTSSIVNNDLLERYFAPNRPPEFYLRAGKLCSWIVVLPLAAFATWSIAAGVTIWQILSIKLELLMQIAPPLWFGVRTRALSGRWAFTAVALSSAFTLACWLGYANEASGAFSLFAPSDMTGWNSAKAPLGLQAGVWGLGINLAICTTGLLTAKRSTAASAEARATS